MPGSVSVEPIDRHQRDDQEAVHEQADDGEDAERAVGEDGQDDGGDDSR